jgi:hypothetical protein
VREHGLPLFVEDSYLAVLDRGGDVTRLPLTGDGAVVALAPYRHSSSASTEEHGSGVRTWWRVAGHERGHRPAQPGDHSIAQVGFTAGPYHQRSWQYEVEWGIAALDRHGTVLLRMRPLRELERVRGFAADCGLAFHEEQITDPARLARSPVVVTGTDVLVGSGARIAIQATALLVALIVGIAVFAAAFAALGAGPSVPLAAVAGFVARLVAKQQLTRYAARVAARSRG